MEIKEMKWYMITTISGKEEGVIESLKNRVISEQLEDLFTDYKVAMVPHVTPSGKEKTKNLFPGYIFIKMVMSNEAWFMVRNTQYVTGLVGSSGQRTKPTPISNTEMRKIDKQTQAAQEEFDKGIRPSPYKVNQFVEVIAGPTIGQGGKVIGVDKVRRVAIVELIIFERKTPTEISFDNLKIKK